MNMGRVVFGVLLLQVCCFLVGWSLRVSQSRVSSFAALRQSSAHLDASIPIVESNTEDLKQQIRKLKQDVLQLGAALDRGQSYNPTAGSYYEDKMRFARQKVEALIAANTSALPKSLADINGEWELVFSSVPHGIFRSSPFFLAIQEAYAAVNAPEKAELFFKLHELQTCSWGISKIGRVAQVIDAEKAQLISEFDTSIFSLTVFPFIGWAKLLPTFGGRVVTVSSVSLQEDGLMKLVVDYTTSKPVKGLRGLGESVWGKKVPVREVWKLLPWNRGQEPTANIRIRYADSDFRVMEDSAGEYFVYTRPVYSEE